MSNTRYVRLWISGFQTQPIAMRDLWRATHTPIALGFGMMFGLTAGAFAAISLHVVGHPWVFVLITFTLAPWALKAFDLALYDLYSRVRGRFVVGTGAEHVTTVPTMITVFLSSLPTVVALIIISEWVYGSIRIDLVWYFLIPLIYVCISEMALFIAFRFVMPEILARVAKDRSGWTSKPSDPKVSDCEINIGNNSYRQDDIIMLESHGNYLQVFTRVGVQMERCKIAAAIEKLPPQSGLQIHRSCWVAFTGVQRLVRKDGALFAEMIDNTLMKVARPRQRQVREAIEGRGIPTVPEQQSGYDKTHQPAP